MAHNHYEFMIAWRFLVKGRTQTILIILGIAMGVAVQFFLSSLISGLQKSIIDRTVGASPHIVILPADSIPTQIGTEANVVKDSKRTFYSERTEIFSWQNYVKELKKDKEIKYISPVINGNGFIQKGETVVPVLIKGLSQPEGLNIYKIKEKLLSGKPEISGDTAVFGKEIADRLAFSVGDKFFLRNDRGQQTFLILGGVFDLGNEAGNKLVILSLDRARAFFNINGISSIEVQVDQVFKAQSIVEEYANNFSRIKMESWQKKNKELLAALSSQSSSSGTIQFFVIFSISLGIASVLGIAAVQKSRQLGILKAMGTTNKSAAKIFIIQGFVLGAVGSIVGVNAGLLLSYIFVKALGSSLTFGFDMSLMNIIMPVILAIIASTLASTIPAKRASKLSPIEVIRNG